MQKRVLHKGDLFKSLSFGHNTYHRPGMVKSVFNELGEENGSKKRVNKHLEVSTRRKKDIRSKQDISQSQSKINSIK